MAHDNLTRMPVPIIGDRPVSGNLIFDFDGYADALSGLIAARDNTTPLSVGIFGPWGSGKTTLMNAIKARLDGGALSDSRRYRYCKTVWFQAWKFDTREEILSALIETIFKAMAADGFFSLARSKIDTLTKRFDKSAIFASISRLVSGVDVSEFFSELANKEGLAFIETFQKFFDDLIWTFLNWRFKLSAQEKPDDKKGAVVIFIDDLDRCRHNRIVQVLETLKLHLDRSGYVFVIGACVENIQIALRKKYGRLDTRGFMEMIFQVEFTLPRILPEKFADIVTEACRDNRNAQTLKDCLPMMMPVLGYSPRKLKRFLNSLNLLHGLVQNTNHQIGFDKVLAWSLITNFFSGLAADIKENPHRLFELRNQIEPLSKKFGETPLWRLKQEQLSAENVPDAWHAYIQQPWLAETVRRADFTLEQLLCLQTLSFAVSSLHELPVIADARPGKETCPRD